ncbi:MAG: hypothetical protein [Olavius algarvensis Gamma 3 endosymbiont]|nr:MAG: hypothetical protein [Olavius algarvensis Gamma 3 endosymbiont]
MKKKTGFTLLELVIVLALVAIVVAFAIPAMTTFAQNDRLTTNINILVGHLSYARSEAVKRSRQVNVCTSTNGTSCGGGGWHDGWMIYVDANNSSSFDNGEEILRVQQALGNNNTITAPTTQFVYDDRGFIAAGGGATLDLCDDRSGNFGKQLQFNNTGRVSLRTNTTC